MTHKCSGHEHRVYREDTKDNSLLFLDYAVSVGKDGNLRIKVCGKSTHTDKYLLFDSHHPLEHKLGVTRRLGPEGSPKHRDKNKSNLHTSG